MLQTILTTIPSYANDIKLNLSSLLQNESHLTKQQFWGTMIACAMACKNKRLMDEIMDEASKQIPTEAIHAAKTAASIMGMNNIYYRFTHLISDTVYTQLPANLRMSMMAKPGIEKKDFELFSIAVSAIHGCGKCLDAHEKNLTAEKTTKNMIQEAIHIASILHATAMIMDTESL